MQPLRPANIPYGYEDYAALPNDGRRWEVIDGKLEVNPAPVPRHQVVSRRLQYELMRVLEERGIAQIFNAPIDLILSPNDIVQPDLVIVRQEREHLITERGIEGPPDLVVEILSPSTAVLDRRVKKRTYWRFGIPEYWVVDPKLGQVELYRLTTQEYALEYRFDRASTLVTASFPEVSIEL